MIYDLLTRFYRHLDVKQYIYPIRNNAQQSNPPFDFGLSLCCHGDKVWVWHWHGYMIRLHLSGSICFAFTDFGQLKTAHVVVLAPLEEVHEVDAGCLHMLKALAGVHLFHRKSTQQCRQNQVLQISGADFLQSLITTKGKQWHKLSFSIDCCVIMIVKDK